MSIPKTQLGWLDTALLLPYAVMQVRERWWERERGRERESEEGEKEREDIIAVFSICTLLRGRHGKKTRVCCFTNFQYVAMVTDIARSPGRQVWTQKDIWSLSFFVSLVHGKI